MTKATINIKPGFVTLRIRFPDYVVNITESRTGFKITSSHPNFLAMYKTDEGRAAVLSLSKIETSQEDGETVAQKMERFRGLAVQSETLIDFVRIAKL